MNYEDLTEGQQQEVLMHPLMLVFLAAVTQAMFGKGERHGGAATPFYLQQWVNLANVHGAGFLTGQAAKKLQEAVEGDKAVVDPDAYQRELLGSLVYTGMALLYQAGLPEVEE